MFTEEQKSWLSDLISEEDMLLAEELNQQEQDLNPPDDVSWNGVF